MPDPAVVDECEGIATLVSSASPIPQSVSNPSRPAFFCEKGLQGVRLRSFDHVQIYGVTDLNQQDVLVAHLRLARQRLKTRMIIVDFYEKENWKPWSDPATGRSGGERGPETAIRRTVID